MFSCRVSVPVLVCSAGVSDVIEAVLEDAACQSAVANATTCCPSAAIVWYFKMVVFRASCRLLHHLVEQGLVLRA